MAAESSLLPSSFEDVNVEDDATTSDLPKNDGHPKNDAQV